MVGVRFDCLRRLFASKAIEIGSLLESSIF